MTWYPCLVEKNGDFVRIETDSFEEAVSMVAKVLQEGKSILLSEEEKIAS